MVSSMVTLASPLWPFTVFPASFSMVMTSCPALRNASAGEVNSESSNSSVIRTAIFLPMVPPLFSLQTVYFPFVVNTYLNRLLSVVELVEIANGQFCKGGEMSQVLITGATGLVGGHLLRLLLQERKVNYIAAPTR